MKHKLSINTLLQRLEDAEGTLSEYKPFIRVGDFGSLGEVERIYGRTTNRIHHLLSRLEQAAFLIFDYNQKVVDIREQFPLVPLEQTIDIARSHNVRHPADPVTKYPIIMTTDFLLTLATESGFEDLAVCVKTREDFDKPRTREKLSIEKTYWKQKGIRWVVLLESSINWKLVENLKELDRLPPSTPSIKKQMDMLESLFRKRPECSIEEILNLFERENDYHEGFGYLVFKYLLLDHRLDLDLREEINLKEGLNESKRDLL